MNKRLSACFVIFALSAGGACAVPDLRDPSPLEVHDAPPDRHGGSTSTSTSPAPTASGEPSSPPSPEGGPPLDAGAGAGARRWTGTLGTTLPVTFGGAPYCSFRITLKNVQVEMIAAASGVITAASATALAVEEVLSSPCGNPPIPPHTQHFSLTSAAVRPSGVTHLVLAPAATNQPLASLVIEGDLRTFNPELTLTWHRTDYGPPLDWTVSVRLTVMSQP
jgi:hypothetical protein